MSHVHTHEVFSRRATPGCRVCTGSAFPDVTNLLGNSHLRHRADLFSYRPGHACRHQTRTLLPGCWVWAPQDLEICWRTSQDLAHRAKISPGQRCVGRSQGLWAHISRALPNGVIQDLPNSPSRSSDNMHEASPPPPQGARQRSAPRVFIGATPCGQPLPGLYQNSRPPGRVGVQHKP